MNAKRIAQCGLLVALSLVLSYLEALVPVSAAVPGVKLGLANLAVVFALYRMGPGEAVGISGVRVILAALLFGTLASFLYSAAGAAASLCVMLALRRRFGVVGVSVGGGAAHVLGQLAAAALMAQTPGLLWYLPVLLLTGTAAGACVGLLGGILIRRVGRR